MYIEDSTYDEEQEKEEAEYANAADIQAVEEVLVKQIPHIVELGCRGGILVKQIPRIVELGCGLSTSG